jgi:hypothetical protein
VHKHEFNCKSMECYEAVETARDLFHFVVMPVFLFCVLFLCIYLGFVTGICAVELVL